MPVHVHAEPVAVQPVPVVVVVVRVAVVRLRGPGVVVVVIGVRGPSCEWVVARGRRPRLVSATVGSGLCGASMSRRMRAGAEPRAPTATGTRAGGSTTRAATGSPEVAKARRLPSATSIGSVRERRARITRRRMVTPIDASISPLSRPSHG